MADEIAVVNFGGQTTHLINRRIRELGVKSRIINSKEATLEELLQLKGVILSGGPASCTDKDAPPYPEGLLEIGIPTLRICYTMQLSAHKLPGGEVLPGKKREYGPNNIEIALQDDLFEGLPGELKVWMSHGDTVSKPPFGYQVTAMTENGLIAAMSNSDKRAHCVQFHPEVTHTEHGMDMLSNFVYNIAGCTKGSWDLKQHVEQVKDYLGETIQGRDVIVFVSGGVDSTVAATILAKAKAEGRNVGNTYAVHIDNGLMRTNESAEVVEYLRKQPGLEQVIFKDYSSIFLERLKGVVDPEEKRKRIGDSFMKECREAIMKELGLTEDNTVLCQGTLYTDIIESGGAEQSARIKTHHNRSPEVLKKIAEGKIVEPNRDLYKDDARAEGELLGIPRELLWRHPFPGPGLAIRIVGGDVTPERLAILRQADDIYISEIKKAGIYDQIWQAFAVLLAGSQAVGVGGDGRTYQYPIVLRAVESKDGMTADWYALPQDLQRRISTRITNEVAGVNRVVVDISSKPPATIEWE